MRFGNLGRHLPAETRGICGEGRTLPRTLLPRRCSHFSRVRGYPARIQAIAGGTPARPR